MTAEIAILNRNAVALAADSAVTIGSGKVYNSVDKLFHLSPHAPLALMTYGNPNCLGVPLEVLIREYRKSGGSRVRPTVAEHAEAFLAHLADGASYPDRIVHEGTRHLVRDEIETVLRIIEDLIYQEYFAQERFPSVADRRALLPRAVEERIRQLEAFEDDPLFGDVDTDLDDAWESFAPLIRESLEGGGEVPPDIVDAFRGLVSARLGKKVPTGHAAGLVFAGFGASEVFPVLLHYQVEARVFGRLKHRRLDESCVDLNTDHIDAHIGAFAQREVVDNFLSGIIPPLDGFLRAYVADVTRELFGFVTGPNVLGGLQLGPDTKARVDGMLTTTIEKFEQELASIQDRYRSRVLGMARWMPKAELAHLAEALVNLQSLRRRVSDEIETVGGPVDVAVVSRTEGFAWIKRKHYFELGTNPRWFMREMAELLKGES